MILLNILVGVDPTMLAMVAASFCVCVSDLPFPLTQSSARGCSANVKRWGGSTLSILCPQALAGHMPRFVLTLALSEPLSPNSRPFLPYELDALFTGSINTAEFRVCESFW